MIQRVRDKVRSFKPQQVISFKDWSIINDKAAKASRFLSEDNVLYQTLIAELKSAQDIILENRVHEVREIRIIGEIQKIFITGREEQMNELVGQVKFIKNFLAELQSWIDLKNHLQKQEADGSIIIRRKEEESLREKA